MPDITRRGLLALLAAPAIVRAESLMPIKVPELVMPASFYGLAVPAGDATIDGAVSFSDAPHVWRHFAVVRNGRRVSAYVDGKRVQSHSEGVHVIQTLTLVNSPRHLDDVRLTTIARRYANHAG